jgi:hypothetical protein
VLPFLHAALTVQRAHDVVERDEKNALIVDRGRAEHVRPHAPRPVDRAAVGFHSVEAPIRRPEVDPRRGRERLAGHAVDFALPQRRALLEVERDDSTVVGGHVQPIALDCRPVIDHADLMRPHDAAVLRPQRDHVRVGDGDEPAAFREQRSSG